MNIENQKANPRMDVLFPLIRLLKIDPRDFFILKKSRVAGRFSYFGFLWIIVLKKKRLIYYRFCSLY